MSDSRKVDEHSATATNDQLVTRDKNVWYYEEQLDVVPEKARLLLETYSKIPPEKVMEHVSDIRERAWQIHPYPCIGRWRFLALNICTTQQYQEILSRLAHEDERLLDLGCCFGQELRQLVHDGAPSRALTGFDLRSEFFELGTALFRDGDRDRDRDRFEAQMIAGDAFDPPAELRALEGSFGIVYAGAFFHLFDRPEQLLLAKLVGRMLRPRPGGFCIGRQVGSRDPGSYDHTTNESGCMFRHDPASWREMWDEAGREMGIEWDVYAELIERDGVNGRNTAELRFCVTRK